MKEIDNYKYIFFKELYNALNLKSLERKLNDENVKFLDIVENDEYSTISNYFFLLNDADLENLSEEQLKKFYTYFSKDINSLTTQELNTIKEFIMETYPLILFPKTDSKYVYYGPANDNYICPRDAIAIGLYYNAVGEYDDFELENKLSGIVNYIQFELTKGKNCKISVIPFNQFSLEFRFNDFRK